MNQTANRLRHIHNEAAIASQSNPFEVMMNGLKEEFGCVSQRYDAIMDIALFYIADELDELQAKVDDLRKQVPSERERQILDMWPRFEDGEPVMVGDKYEDNEGHECFASGVHLDIDGPSLVDSEGFHDLYRKGKRVKRPAPKVLDADGVEIKVGDTVYEPNGQSGIVTAVHPSTRCVDLRQDGCDAFCMDANRLTHACPVLDADGVPIHEGDTVWIIPAVTDTPDEPHEVKHINRWGEVLLEFHFERSTGVKGEYLTHTRPDSWERLEEDAEFNDETGIVGGNLDIVRRAKALAGVEVD